MIGEADALQLRYTVEDMLQQVAEDIILPRYQSLSDNQIKTKSSPDDLVTIADEEAEKELTKRLTTLKPGSSVVGEEGAAADPSILGRLAQPGSVWVIDPIDGTGNFVAGYAAFAVVVALVEDGETVMGWMHEPLESRSLWAARGRGAWIGEYRQTLDSTAETDLSAMAASLYHRAFKPALKSFSRTSRIGSAAHEYWALAENRVQVSCFSRLKPWDHAAGVLIHEEAGGYSAMTDGTPYNPADQNKRGILSAPSKAVWDKVHALANKAHF